MRDRLKRGNNREGYNLNVFGRWIDGFFYHRRHSRTPDTLDCSCAGQDNSFVGGRMELWGNLPDFGNLADCSLVGTIGTLDVMILGEKEKIIVWDVKVVEICVSLLLIYKITALNAK